VSAEQNQDEFNFSPLSPLSPLANVVEKEDITEPSAIEVEMGVIFTSGNTDTSSITARISGRQDLPKWNNDYVTEILVKQDNVTGQDEEKVTQTTAQKLYLAAQGNYKLTDPHHRLFVFASYEDDRFSNFSFQSTLATGWNQKLWQSETSHFEYSVGPGYAFAETQSEESQNGVIMRGALDYFWKLSEFSNFTQQFSLEVGQDNTKSKSSSSVSSRISGALEMKISVALDHNTRVESGRQKLDTQMAVTLVYRFN
jgi:putative salt-induced outer membrane protein YdiY